jgi:hypothetical protein
MSPLLLYCNVNMHKVQTNFAFGGLDPNHYWNRIPKLQNGMKLSTRWKSGFSYIYGKVIESRNQLYWLGHWVQLWKTKWQLQKKQNIYICVNQVNGTDFGEPLVLILICQSKIWIILCILNATTYLLDLNLDSH